jgi:hypothetical protein
MGCSHVRALGNLESGKLGGPASKRLAISDRSKFQISKSSVSNWEFANKDARSVVPVQDGVRGRRCNSIAL